MTIKPDALQSPVSKNNTTATAASGLFDFGAASGTRKRLFQFVKRSPTSALGPTRSEFGCD